MPKRDPIATVALIAVFCLAVLAAIIYFDAADKLFTQPAAKPPVAFAPTTTRKTAPPLPTHTLSPGELQQLTPAERAEYQTLQQSLQQILQQSQSIDQENQHLEQAIQASTQANQTLGKEVDKLRPPSKEK